MGFVVDLSSKNQCFSCFLLTKIHVDLQMITNGKYKRVFFHFFHDLKVTFSDNFCTGEHNSRAV